MEEELPKIGKKGLRKCSFKDKMWIGDSVRYVWPRSVAEITVITNVDDFSLFWKLKNAGV